MAVLRLGAFFADPRREADLTTVAIPVASASAFTGWAGWSRAGAIADSFCSPPLVGGSLLSGTLPLLCD
jgi:hypothetical protein